MSEIGFAREADGRFPPELELDLGGLTLRGTSIAARATAFSIPGLEVALDLGRLTPAIAEQPTVLLSHGHLDHLSGVLAYLNVRARFYPDVPPRVIAPDAVAAGLREALAVMPGMESVRKRLRLDRVILGAKEGVRVDLSRGVAQAFATDHGAPSLGWAIYRGREKRAALVYAGDGTTAPFKAAPELLNAHAALVECTFVEKNRRVAAHLAKHAHLKDWLEVAPTLRCNTLVLAHLPPLERTELEWMARPLANAFPGRLVLWAGPDV